MCDGLPPTFEQTAARNDAVAGAQPFVCSTRSDYADAPVLSQINAVWDGVTMPIRNGVVNIFRDDTPTAGAVTAPGTAVAPAPQLAPLPGLSLGQNLGG